MASSLCCFKLVFPILKVERWRENTAPCDKYLSTGTLAAPRDTITGTTHAGSLCSPGAHKSGSQKSNPHTHTHTPSLGLQSRETDPSKWEEAAY